MVQSIHVSPKCVKGLELFAAYGTCSSIKLGAFLVSGKCTCNSVDHMDIHKLSMPKQLETFF